MAVSFPQNPEVGDRYSTSTYTYEWDGEKWVSLAGLTGGAGVGPPGPAGAPGSPGGATGATGPQGEGVPQDLQNVTDTGNVTTNYIKVDASEGPVYMGIEEFSGGGPYAFAVEAGNSGNLNFSINAYGKVYTYNDIISDWYLWVRARDNTAGIYNYQNNSTASVGYVQNDSAGNQNIQLFWDGRASFSNIITASGYNLESLTELT